MFQAELLDVHCSEKYFLFFFFSVSLDLLALCPRLSPPGPGGETPGEEMKQRHGRVREFISERVALCSLTCVVSHHRW